MIANVATLDHYTSAPAFVSSAVNSEFVNLGFELVAEMPDTATTNYPKDVFATHFARLDQLLTDQNAAEEGEEAPSQLAGTWARFILQKLQVVGLPPDKILASAEGGIGICFVEGKKYADIECLNSGVVLGVTSDRRSRPNVWEVEQSSRGALHAAELIAGFLHRY